VLEEPAATERPTVAMTATRSALFRTMEEVRSEAGTAGEFEAFMPPVFAVIFEASKHCFIPLLFRHVLDISF
jgi:hypothetical protein